MHDDVKTVTNFSYLGDRINSGGGREAAVTFRTRLEWVKYRDFQDLSTQKFTSENQKKCIKKLCEISNALCKREIVHRPE